MASYYRIIDQKGPVRFVIKDQLTGTTVQQRIRAKKLMDDQQHNTEPTEETFEDYESESENENPESQITSDNSGLPLIEDMEVDEVRIGLGFTPTPKQRKPNP